MESVINLLDQKKNTQQINAAPWPCYALILASLVGIALLIRQFPQDYQAHDGCLKHTKSIPPGHAQLFFRPVDLNSASLEELTGLPGIGEKRAADILALRASVGFFFSRDELYLPAGPISPKLIRSITPYISASDNQEGK